MIIEKKQKSRAEFSARLLILFKLQFSEKHDNVCRFSG